MLLQILDEGVNLPRVNHVDTINIKAIDDNVNMSKNTNITDQSLHCAIATRSHSS